MTTEEIQDVRRDRRASILSSYSNWEESFYIMDFCDALINNGYEYDLNLTDDDLKDKINEYLYQYICGYICGVSQVREIIFKLNYSVNDQSYKTQIKDRWDLAEVQIHGLYEEHWTDAVDIIFEELKNPIQ